MVAKPSANKTGKKRSGRPPTKVSNKSLWADLIALGDAIPASERRKIPRDASANLDHYLYGAPKRRR